MDIGIHLGIHHGMDKPTLWWMDGLMDKWMDGWMESKIKVNLSHLLLWPTIILTYHNKYGQCNIFLTQFIF